jgi:sortase A
MNLAVCASSALGTRAAPGIGTSAAIGAVCRCLHAEGAPELTEFMDSRRRRLLLLAERTSWAFGLAGLVVWGAFHIAVTAWTRHELDLFAALQTVALEAGKPDQSLWSPERVSAWRKTLAEPARAPLGVLRIQKIRLEVPVLPGTSEHTLDRGVGHIEDTAEPGTDGNSGIAGHRDGFFRGLKDIAPGDSIELETLKGKEVYRVERTWVVDPEDVWVLDPTPTRALTLVTCYPFYYVGSAPQRFIVRAVLAGNTAAASPPAAEYVSCPLCESWRLLAAFWSSHLSEIVA